MSQDSYLNFEYAKMAYRVFRPYLNELQSELSDTEIVSLPEEYATKLFEKDLLPENIVQKIILPRLQTVIDTQAAQQTPVNKVSKSFVQLTVNEDARLDRDYTKDKNLVSPWHRDEEFANIGGFRKFNNEANSLIQHTLNQMTVFDTEGSDLLDRTAGQIAGTLRDSIKNFMSTKYVTDYIGNNDSIATTQKDLEDLLKDIEETVKLTQSA
jgi:hypothetical protein